MKVSECKWISTRATFFCNQGVISFNLIYDLALDLLGQKAAQTRYRPFLEFSVSSATSSRSMIYSGAPRSTNAAPGGKSSQVRGNSDNTTQPIPTSGGTDARLTVRRLSFTLTSTITNLATCRTRSCRMCAMRRDVESSSGCLHSSGTINENSWKDWTRLDACCAWVVS